MARKKIEEVIAEPDASAWVLANAFAKFVLMHTKEVKYMVMLGYTFLHGTKVFAKLPAESAVSYRFINMIFACTGGGILVPIMVNGIPVPLAQDAYPIAILISFLLHNYFGILREIVGLSTIFKGGLICLYETMRAFVVWKFTCLAGDTITPSEFSFPVFGPIFCGTLAGCGGMFLPLDKGLSPIKDSGLIQPIFSALIGATCLHLFLNTSLSEGVVDAKKKGHVMLAAFFIIYHLYDAFGDKLFSQAEEEPAGRTKKKASKKKD